MQRRDALKFLATGALATAAAPELFAFFQEAHPASGYALRTLNPHQNATVVLMSEMIIPETDTPGASPAQQLTLLRALDEAVGMGSGRTARHGNTVPEWDTQLRGNFFTVFKGITLHGYYTSEVGFSRELGLQIIPGAQHGCVPVAAERKA